MKKAILVGMTVTALAVPNVEALAAVKATKTVPKKKVVIATKSFTGVAGPADRWGDVVVTIIVKKTTTTVLSTRKKTVARRITKVAVPTYPDHTDRSVFINQQALPILIQETLQAQSTGIQMVSGATATSYGFESSLQSAIIAAKQW
ncbi:MAG TPA: hypothetical protein VI408_14020 [Gaiellaceae bacterium]